LLPNGQKDITDYNLNYQSLSSFDSFEVIPEISHLVLSACFETIPSEMKFLDNIDHYRIMDRILIPYFEKSPRILKENNFFTVNESHFKVISSDPVCGMVTKNTKIFCYK
jgi:hypothetical protein